MDQEDHLAILRDEARVVVERIRAAVNGNLEIAYWDNPNKSPPNLAESEFRNVLNYVPLNTPVRWEDRKSNAGPHGLTGEDLVFNINFSIPRGRKIYQYYLKGFFFDKGNLVGICIQSFRIEKILNRQNLRVIRKG